MLTGKVAAEASVRRGRPPGTSRRELELIALRLFTDQGFDNTTIEQIAAEAGVRKRTFFRYFSSKAGVLWSEFDHEVDVIRAALAEVPAGVPMMAAIRRAVVAANHYGPHDVPELRMRMNLIGSVPALQSSAAIHYDAWERAISDFAATRVGQPADSLYPLTVGRATLAGLPRGLRPLVRPGRRRPDLLSRRGAGRARSRVRSGRDPGQRPGAQREHLEARRHLNRRPGTRRDLARRRPGCRTGPRSRPGVAASLPG